MDCGHESAGRAVPGSESRPIGGRPQAAAGDISELLSEQMAYYRARSPEYDQWWLRTGKYDRGAQFLNRWIDETNHVRAALDEFGARGRVLEIACGTGWWTPQLAAKAEQITVIDASSEMLERCRARVAADKGSAAKLECLHSDIWEWRPVRRYHAVFFGFWLSHVPEARFDSFWEQVDRALLPGGRVFFVDSADPSGSSRTGGPAEQTETERRELNDGRRYEIVKRYFDPGWLRQRLAGIGWDFEVRRTAEFFLYARGSRAADPRMLIAGQPGCGRPLYPRSAKTVSKRGRRTR